MRFGRRRRKCKESDLTKLQNIECKDMWIRKKVICKKVLDGLTYIFAAHLAVYFFPALLYGWRVGILCIPSMRLRSRRCRRIHWVDRSLILCRCLDAICLRSLWRVGLEDCGWGLGVRWWKRGLQRVMLSGEVDWVVGWGIASRGCLISCSWLNVDLICKAVERWWRRCDYIVLLDLDW